MGIWVNDNKSGRKCCLHCEKKLPKDFVGASISTGSYNGERLICNECLLEILIKTDFKQYLTRKAKSIAIAREV